MRKLILGLAILLVAGQVQASLIGDEVRCRRIFQNNTFLDQTVIVQAGPFECQELPPDGYTLNIEDSSIRFDTGNNIGQYGPEPHLFVFDDLDWVNQPGRIVDVSFVSQGVQNVDITDVSFTDNSVTVSIADMITVADAFWEVRLEVQHIPEPAPLALLAMGLAAVGFARRRH